MKDPEDQSTMRECLDEDDSSMASFVSLPKPSRPCMKFAWMGGSKVDADNFLTMQQNYLQMKEKDKQNEIKIKQLTAQLARTEEAAKRVLLQSDASARGGVAQQLIDIERMNQKLTSINQDLDHKLSKERKRANDYRVSSEKSKKKVDNLLREQRQLVRQIGEIDIKKNRLRRRAVEDQSEEDTNRFVKQQEEIAMLREENENYKARLQTAHWQAWEQKAIQWEGKAKELEQQLIRLQTTGENTAATADFLQWRMEDFTDGNEAFLKDPSTLQLFNYPEKNTVPKLAGHINLSGQVVHLDKQWLDTVTRKIDGFLNEQEQSLQDKFKDVVGNNPCVITKEGTMHLLKDLFIEAETKWLADVLLFIMSKKVGDKINIQDMKDLLKMLGSAAKSIRSGEWNTVQDSLKRPQTFIRNSYIDFEAGYKNESKTKDGCLSIRDLIHFFDRFVPDLTTREHMFLVLLFKYWDTMGSGIILQQVLQALEIGEFSRIRIQQADPDSWKRIGSLEAFTQDKNNRSPARPMFDKDDFKENSLTVLNEEILEVRKHEEILRAQNSKLRCEIAELESKNRELEDIALLSSTIPNSSSIDSQIKSAWKSCNAFKKRYMECRNKLDSIKKNHGETLQQLSETHAGLQQQISDNHKLEMQLSKLNLKLVHTEDLETMLKAEREERLRIEKDLIDAQQKAFSAPGGALKEVASLRQEILSLQKSKILAERKEAEVRQELLSLRQAVNGFTAADFSAMERELRDLRQQNSHLQIEVETAAEKVSIYQRKQPFVDGVNGSLALETLSIQHPDDEKQMEELRIELCELRELHAKECDQARKMQALLHRESEIAIEARAALDATETALDETKQELGNQISALKRDIDKKNEKIHQLDAQLKGTVSGLGKALVRASTSKKINSLGSAMVEGELRECESVFELLIVEAQLGEVHFGRDPSTFVSVDFFEHDTQTTGVATGLRPKYDTNIKYVVEPDDFFVRYLDTAMLVLELNQARGWEYDPVATGRMPLRRVIEDVETGGGIGEQVSFHHVDMIGATGAILGTLRFGFRIQSLIHAAITRYEMSKTTRAQPQIQMDVPQEQLAYLQVVVKCCKNLSIENFHGLLRPFVRYRIPGSNNVYDTQIESGPNPEFRDEAMFELARTENLESNLKNQHLVLEVHNASSDASHSELLGKASMPLHMLLQGIAIHEASYALMNSKTNKIVGTIVASVGWSQPLRLPSMLGGPEPNSSDLEKEQVQGVNSGGAHEEHNAARNHSQELGPARKPVIEPETQSHFGHSTRSADIEGKSNPALEAKSNTGPVDIAITIPVDCRHWPNPRDFLVAHVVSITLDPPALACPEIQSIIIVQSFLDDLCSLDVQGSQPIHKSAGSLLFDHAVGYNIRACSRVVQSMINKKECILYLGVVSQIDGSPSVGDVKFLDIGMVEIDLVKIKDSKSDFQNTTARIASSDKYKALTGEDYLGHMKLSIRGKESLWF